MDTFREKHSHQAGEQSVMLMGKVARFIGAALLALFATISSAQAVVESVPPVTFWCDGEAGVCTYSTDLAAAQAQAATYNLYKAPLNPGQVTMFIVSCNGNGVCLYGIGPGPFTYGYPNVYIRSVYPVCPVPTINPTVLYNYWPSSGMCERTVQETCPIVDLPPITDPEVQKFEDNPNLSDIVDLTPRTQTALLCLQSAAAAGNPSVGSAYRPPAYNQHLIDVWNKWIQELKNSTNPACADLRTKIQAHFKQHKLKELQGPVPKSLHTQGEAVDVTITLPPANIDALAPPCHLYRPPSLRVKDPVHFIYK